MYKSQETQGKMYKRENGMIRKTKKLISTTIGERCGKTMLDTKLIIKDEKIIIITY